jgi:SAM-dependent methyltransferase
MKKNLYYKSGNEGNVAFLDRWKDLEEILDLKQSDSVLDIGCAEGLISIEVAKRVDRVEAFELEPHRVKVAKENARRFNIKNINFSVGSFTGFNYQTYNKILCLGVYHKIRHKNTRVSALERMFQSCLEQFYIRVPVLDGTVPADRGIDENEILDTASKYGFELALKTKQRPDHGSIFKFLKRINTV